MVWGWLLAPLTLGLAQGADFPGGVPQYDVVTVRVNREGGWGDLDSDADSYTATNASLRMLIADAYGVRRDAISGIPKALAELRFNLQAKVVDPETIRGLKDEERPAMLQKVLEDRFHLEAHIERKTLPVYELFVAGSRPKLKETPKEEQHGSDMDVHRRWMEAKDATMRDLADALSGQMDHDVIDRTGLEQHYSFTLRWSPDAAAAADVMAPPDIFEALPDQLGLKLRIAKGPARTLVVDRVEMPGEN